MKYYVFMFAAVASAQSVTSSYTTDINGNRVADGSIVASDSTVTRTTRSINGGQVPVEETTEHVLSQTQTTKVTEKIVRHFDQTGRSVSTDRIVTEQQKQPSGETVHITTFRSDINGALKEDERKTVETTTRGAVTNTDTTVARSTPNGFGTVEKRASVTESANTASHTDETVYRLGTSGSFYPAFRSVTDTTQNGNQTVSKTAEYEPIEDATKMQLSRQIVATTTTRSDGSSTQLLDYYGRSVPGNVRDPNAPQQLYEQDTIERTPGPGGSLTETLRARRASPSNPAQLGPSIRISETVCTGKCTPSTTTPPPQQR